MIVSYVLVTLVNRPEAMPWEEAAAGAAEAVASRA
ncbi:hypothetical protein HNR51_001245 [Methylorubrum thiocyanatum]|uniref:Uncharacterized protein n=1 Tax=Methylorubrum thiocyanatum TaxID=47958 RepID=A0AA40V9U7_9HYPH|nr:hypothetical protein [Methylorubrum thiocyanatum]